jgi:hypothetical protein
VVPKQAPKLGPKTQPAAPKIPNDHHEYPHKTLKTRQTDFGAKDYETLALPLSYAGRNEALHVTDAF